MANGDEGKGLPPSPMRGADRGSPSMNQNPETSDMMRKIAERQGGKGQGGGEEQSAQALMQGAQMLMQAAQMNPKLAPIVQRAVSVLRDGVQSLASGAGGSPPAVPKQPRPSKRGKKQGDEMGEQGGEMQPTM